VIAGTKYAANSTRWRQPRQSVARPGMNVRVPTKIEMKSGTWWVGHTVAWMTGDEVYGGNPALVQMPAQRQTGSVMAVSCRTKVRTAGGKVRVDSLVRKVPRTAWQRMSAGGDAEGSGFRAHYRQWRAGTTSNSVGTPRGGLPSRLGLRAGGSQGWVHSLFLAE
jgi:hypothetical protein